MGSAGFLLEAANYVEKHYQNELMNVEKQKHFKTDMFSGFDTDQSMLRIGAMNMLLHGAEAPNIKYQDSLSGDNEERNKYSLIMANPPLSIEQRECNNYIEDIDKKLHTKEISRDDYVVVISNLPYTIRVGTTEGNKKIYEHLKHLMDTCPRWSFFLLTADKALEKELGKKADRRRKLYNGTIETQFYQFHGERPAKQDSK